MMNICLECRTCLGKFENDDIIHLESEVINHMNILQAIEEVAAIKILEKKGFPQHICKKCLILLESCLIFRKQIINSDCELRRRLLQNQDLSLSNDPLSSNDYSLYSDNKQEVRKEITFPASDTQKNTTSCKDSINANNDSVKSPSKDSDDDWNDINGKYSDSDNEFIEETNSYNKTPINNKQLPTKKNDEETINGKEKVEKSNTILALDNTIKKTIFANTEKDETESSEGNINSSDNIKSKNKSNNSTKNLRSIQRKRILKKSKEDISDSSSGSDSDSDIPLGEWVREIKDLENNESTKVRKKRGKKENVDGPRLCPICGKLFKARQNFNSHMTTVHRKKPDKPEKISCLCPDCGRVITGTRQNFVAHRRYHHSDKAQVKKRFICDLCPRKFYREKNLIIHQRIHKGEKGYVCELCPDKSYTQIGGLILHKRKVHLKKPTCTCNYCGKQFYEKHYLETHIRQWHTGERPFSCEICGKSFSCNGTLLRHRKDSHGEKQPCPKCGKMYTEGELRKHLKRHKIREEGIKRKKYTCEYCGTEMNFTSRKRHLLKQHGIMLRGRGENAERIPVSRADTM